MLSNSLLTQRSSDEKGNNWYENVINTLLHASAVYNFHYFGNLILERYPHIANKRDIKIPDFPFLTLKIGNTKHFPK